MNPSELEIKVDDLRSPEINEFLAEHLRCLAEVSPPESMHALNHDELRAPGVTFWSVWSDRELVGCGALNQIDADRQNLPAKRHRDFAPGAHYLGGPSPRLPQVESGDGINGVFRTCPRALSQERIQILSTLRRLP
jgi:hypothetical protein